MKMSETNYKRLTDFYNYTVENATDMEVEYIFKCLSDAARVAVKKIDKMSRKHGKN